MADQSPSRNEDMDSHGSGAPPAEDTPAENGEKEHLNERRPETPRNSRPGRGMLFESNYAFPSGGDEKETEDFIQHVADEAANEVASTKVNLGGSCGKLNRLSGEFKKKIDDFCINHESKWTQEYSLNLFEKVYDSGKGMLSRGDSFGTVAKKLFGPYMKAYGKRDEAFENETKAMKTAAWNELLTQIPNDCIRARARQLDGLPTTSVGVDSVARMPSDSSSSGASRRRGRKRGNSDSRSDSEESFIPDDSSDKRRKTDKSGKTD
ncbi:hypothetical protein SEMRO_3168_G344690.1 [Seminavis robusta]|uniref:Uncharacterized protein n=1 Tax=Seminavis robusta TaxID=568900 RepID=A0A9N8F178_9STRA|nr:hypothetical protein SEMRO_3168_G344690.1 [Seminavis robusta]|eukprot:Sro3168_g344690.1 n/a (265) ;mRNA; f:2098-2892